MVDRWKIRGMLYDFIDLERGNVFSSFILFSSLYFNSLSLSLFCLSHISLKVKVPIFLI